MPSRKEKLTSRADVEKIVDVIGEEVGQIAGEDRGIKIATALGWNDCSTRSTGICCLRSV